MSELNLLPCPFCQGVAHYEAHYDDRDNAAIVCDECGANVGANDCAKGVAAWNRRATQPASAPADHEIREAINQLREVAMNYYATSQLRSRIADIVLPLVKRGPAVPCESKDVGAPQGQAEPVAGAHHLTPESIAATIKDLRAIENGTTERPVLDRDWRTWAGVLHRIISHLAAPTQPAEREDP